MDFGHFESRVIRVPRTLRLAVVSDIHYAGASERRRSNHESSAVRNPALRLALAAWRRWVWLAEPFAHNGLLDDFVEANRSADLVIANGDYSCDTAFIGVADTAAYQSAEECLSLLGGAFSGRLLRTLGDHELGKKSFFGGAGGMRLASWSRAVEGLGIEPSWTFRVGRYHLVGVSSSIWALPVFAHDALPSEWPEWNRIRKLQETALERQLGEVQSSDRWILFCHDPTALPFLAKNPAVTSRLDQLECTIIGHLHSELIYWKGRLLSGMPPITFLGNSVRRMSRALRMSTLWPRFRVRLCPSPAGLELRKDGGYLHLDLHPEFDHPLRIHRRRLERAPKKRG